MIPKLSDALLLGYLHEILDPGREREVRARLAQDPRARRRLEALTLEEAVPVSPPLLWVPLGTWGLSARTRVAPAAVMAGGADRVRPNDRVRVRFEAPPLQDACVTVLWRDLEAWRVLLPGPDEADLPVDVLPLDEQRFRWLDVVVQSTPARQRWVVVVGPPGSLDRSDSTNWSATITRGVLERSLLVIAHEVELQSDEAEQTDA